MNNPPKHLIIMPVYNDPEQTKKCLNSLIRNTDLNKNQLCIIDDGSDQETKNLLKKFQQKYPQINLLENKRNLGKPKSINNAIYLFPNIDYYTIIDNDVIVKTKNWPNRFKK